MTQQQLNIPSKLPANGLGATSSDYAYDAAVRENLVTQPAETLHLADPDRCPIGITDFWTIEAGMGRLIAPVRGEQYRRELMRYSEWLAQHQGTIASLDRFAELTSTTYNYSVLRASNGLYAGASVIISLQDLTITEHERDFLINGYLGLLPFGYNSAEIADALTSIDLGIPTMTVYAHRHAELRADGEPESLNLYPTGS